MTFIETRTGLRLEGPGRREAESDSGNVIAYLEMQKRQFILFSAHMDTVVPGKILSRNDGNKIASSGDTILADDKAAIAIILETLRIIKENNISHGIVPFLFMKR